MISARSIKPGLRILIVEDEAMISMLIEDLLEDMGCSVAGLASDLDSALASVSSLEFDAVILDVNLQGSKSYPVADALTRMGIPFVMVTGYGAGGVLDAYRGGPILGKPFKQTELADALLSVLPADQALARRASGAAACSTRPSA